MKTRKRFANWLFYKTRILGIAAYWKNRIIHTSDVFHELSCFIDFYNTTSKKKPFEKKTFREALQTRLFSELARIKRVAQTNQNLAIVSLGNLSDLRSRMVTSHFSGTPDDAFQKIEEFRKELCNNILEDCEETGRTTSAEIFFISQYGDQKSLDDLMSLLAKRDDWDLIAVYRESLFQIIQGNHVCHEKMTRVFLANESFARDSTIHARLSGITEEYLGTHDPYEQIIALYSSIRRALP